MTNFFDNLWVRAIKTIDRNPVAASFDAAPLAGPLDKLSFPARLALAARGSASRTGTEQESWLSALAEQVLSEGVLTSADVAPDDIEAALKAFFSGRLRHAGPLDHERTAREVTRLATKLLTQETGGIEDSEVIRAAELIKNGAFFGDIARSTAAVLAVAPTLPLSLVRDVRMSPAELDELAGAVVNDITDLADPRAFIRNFVQGKLKDRSPSLLTHTLTWFYDRAAAKEVVDTMNTLIAPENEFIRLAIVIYAKANGIDLREEDLDVLRETVLDTSDPDLGPALVRAVEILSHERKAEEVLKKLDEMGIRIDKSPLPRG